MGLFPKTFFNLFISSSIFKSLNKNPCKADQAARLAGDT
jgi:hypothetical protein